MGETLRQPLAPGLEEVESFASNGTATEASAKTKRMFEDSELWNIARIQALREVKEWVRANKYPDPIAADFIAAGLLGNTRAKDLIGADDLDAKLDEMIEEASNA